MGDPPTEQQNAKSAQEFDQLIRVAELSFEGIKWFDAQSTEALKVAARTLWLSNAGGLALIVGLAAKAENTTMYAAIALVAAAIAFIIGVYLGVDPHVRMAHNVAQFQVNAAKIALTAIEKQRTPDQALYDLRALVPDLPKKIRVITENLVWAKWSLGIGALLGVVGLCLMLTRL